MQSENTRDSQRSTIPIVGARYPGTTPIELHQHSQKRCSNASIRVQPAGEEVEGVQRPNAMGAG